MPGGWCVYCQKPSIYMGEHYGWIKIEGSKAQGRLPIWICPQCAKERGLIKKEVKDAGANEVDGEGKGGGKRRKTYPKGDEGFIAEFEIIS